MNTKAEAVYHYECIARIWVHIGIVAIVAAIGLVLYVGYLHLQLSNCYAGGIQ